MQVCISSSFYSCILTYIEMRYIIEPRRKQIFFTLNYRKSIYNESKYKKGAITMKVNKNMVSGNTAMLILKLISEKDMYGYEMIDTLSKRSDNVFELKVVLHPVSF